MKTEHSKLMDKIIQNLDWDSILAVHKVFKRGVGEGNEVIPGLKRKVYSESLSKTDLKNELKTLIKYMVSNHIPQISYGHWIIYWINDEWDVDFSEEEDDEEELEDVEYSFIMEPQLEVIYSPQRITLKGEASVSESDRREFVNLEDMLEKAIKNEDYELATKIRDLIKNQNKEKKLDK